MTTSDHVGLSETERAVLSVVLTRGETTRPEIGGELGLSKPTVSAAVSRLEAESLVHAVSARQGSLGRAAAVYAVAPTAGWLLGVDVGSTRVQLLARALDGRTVRSSRRELRRRGGDVLDALREEVAGYLQDLPARYGPLRSVGIALPRIIPDYVAAATAERAGAEHTLAGILDALALPAGVPILLENNVNCAALAEMERGAARGHDDFVFLQVGVRVGAGIVADRRVLRGAHGAAGEVAAVPVGWPAREPASPTELEQYLGSASFLERCRAQWDDAEVPAPRSLPGLFRHAERGHQVAVRAVEQHARDVAHLAMTLSAVLDPGLLVLGGGVGQNALMSAAVHRAVAERAGGFDVAASALGDQATVEGAVALTLDRTLTSMLGSRHVPRLDQRTTVLTTG
ncbi:ROK family protein [Kineococcus sp. SYSU DK006]|uniref:ROK family protein n=1 Tax=Kineococcus sp. SYSU DK006 TaxID=3383127 RepID=UPI003D7E4F0C